MTPEERRVRASRIRELLQHDEVNNAFTDIEAQFVEQWKDAFDAKERDNLWQAVRILRQLRQHLGALSSEGRLEREAVTAIRRIR